MSTTTSKTTVPKIKVKKVTASKKLSLRLDAPLYDYLVKKAATHNRNLSNFLKSLIYDEMDTTDYLLLSSKNVEMLEKSLKEASEGKLINNKSTELWK